MSLTSTFSMSFLKEFGSKRKWLGLSQELVIACSQQQLNWGEPGRSGEADLETTGTGHDVDQRVHDAQRVGITFPISLITANDE